MFLLPEGKRTRIKVRMIADSVNPDGARLTTVEAIFNRWILAELNTHRMFSRNSASSRAIPVKKMLTSVLRDPAVPVAWGANQSGMQARSDLSGWRQWVARQLFLWARLPVLVFVWLLSKLGLHKQVANRLLEPWMWHTAVVSFTDSENFFKQRLHPDAQPEFQELAREFRAAMNFRHPVQVEWGVWHLPYVNSLDYVEAAGSEMGAPKSGAPLVAYTSAARCGRVSFLRQGERRSLSEDVGRTESFIKGGHWSPMEHPAVAVKDYVGGNFTGGWQQFRKFFKEEDGRDKNS